MNNVRQVTNHGRTRWVVDIYEEGDRKRYFRNTKEEAEKLSRDLRREREQLGMYLSTLRPENRVALALELRRLEPEGVTLHEVVDFWFANRRTRKPPLLSALIEECLKSKRDSGTRRRYWQQITYRFAALLEALGDKPINQIRTTEIHDWLYGGGLELETIRHYLGDVRMLFNFAKNRDYCESNPAAAVDRPARQQKPPVIVPVDECAALLRACQVHLPAIRPALAIMMLSGLRTSEVQRLTWQDIKAGYIDVPAHKAKTRQRRLVEIGPALRGWLDLGGELPPVDLNRRMIKLCRLAGISRPSQNALRHSFGSYHYALLQNEGKTASEMGNSPDMVFRHYRAVVLPAEAARFFDLSPAKVLGVAAVAAPAPAPAAPAIPGEAPAL